MNNLKEQTETIADIVAEMKAMAAASIASGIETGDPDERDTGEQLMDYAVRIEAAVKRERYARLAAVCLHPHNETTSNAEGTAK